MEAHTCSRVCYDQLGAASSKRAFHQLHRRQVQIKQVHLAVRRDQTAGWGQNDVRVVQVLVVGALFLETTERQSQGVLLGKLAVFVHPRTIQRLGNLQRLHKVTGSNPRVRCRTRKQAHL